MKRLLTIITFLFAYMLTSGQYTYKVLVKDNLRPVRVDSVIFVFPHIVNYRSYNIGEYEFSYSGELVFVMLSFEYNGKFYPQTAYKVRADHIIEVDLAENVTYKIPVVDQFGNAVNANLKAYINGVTQVFDRSFIKVQDRDLLTGDITLTVSGDAYVPYNAWFTGVDQLTRSFPVVLTVASLDIDAYDSERRQKLSDFTVDFIVNGQVVYTKHISGSDTLVYFDKILEHTQTRNVEIRVTNRFFEPAQMPLELDNSRKHQRVPVQMRRLYKEVYFYNTEKFRKGAAYLRDSGNYGKRLRIERTDDKHLIKVLYPYYADRNEIIVIWNGKMYNTEVSAGRIDTIELLRDKSLKATLEIRVDSSMSYDPKAMKSLFPLYLISLYGKKIRIDKPGIYSVQKGIYTIRAANSNEPYAKLSFEFDGKSLDGQIPVVILDEGLNELFIRPFHNILYVIEIPGKANGQYVIISDTLEARHLEFNLTNESEIARINQNIVIADSQKLHYYEPVWGTQTVFWSSGVKRVLQYVHPKFPKQGATSFFVLDKNNFSLKPVSGVSLKKGGNYTYTLKYNDCKIYYRDTVIPEFVVFSGATCKPADNCSMPYYENILAFASLLMDFLTTRLLDKRELTSYDIVELDSLSRKYLADPCMAQSFPVKFLYFLSVIYYARYYAGYDIAYLDTAKKILDFAYNGYYDFNMRAVEKQIFKELYEGLTGIYTNPLPFNDTVLTPVKATDFKAIVRDLEDYEISCTSKQMDDRQLSELRKQLKEFSAGSDIYWFWRAKLVYKYQLYRKYHRQDDRKEILSILTRLSNLAPDDMRIGYMKEVFTKPQLCYPCAINSQWLENNYPGDKSYVDFYRDGDNLVCVFDFTKHHGLGRYAYNKQDRAQLNTFMTFIDTIKRYSLDRQPVYIVKASSDSKPIVPAGIKVDRWLYEKYKNRSVRVAYSHIVSPDITSRTYNSLAINTPDGKVSMQVPQRIYINKQLSFVRGLVLADAANLFEKENVRFAIFTSENEGKKYRFAGLVVVFRDFYKYDTFDIYLASTQR